MIPTKARRGIKSFLLHNGISCLQKYITKYKRLYTVVIAIQKALLDINKRISGENFPRKNKK